MTSAGAMPFMRQHDLLSRTYMISEFYMFRPRTILPKNDLRICTSRLAISIFSFNLRDTPLVDPKLMYAQVSPASWIALLSRAHVQMVKKSTGKQR